jgi:16S rRNA (guanine527-N7)-methyltransferase
MVGGERAQDVSAGPGAGLSPHQRTVITRVLELLREERASVSSVTELQQAWRVHVADSLTGLEVGGLREASRVADIGSGAGFPGLILAVAMPQAEVDLIESVGRKCDFMRRAISAAGIPNARVIEARSEEWATAAGREAYEGVTARAVGRLSTLAELASPLLSQGGLLVAWKGKREEGEELQLQSAAARLAMQPRRVLSVGPLAGSEHRHLHIIRKSGPTPPDLPRRPGMAKKRPRG